MGRPSKLSDKQWDELKLRLLSGEKAADLSREYGVSKTAISTRVSKRIETVKSVANQLVSAESSLKSLPLSEQFLARSMADDLISIRRDMAAAGRYSAASAHRMSAITCGLVQKLDDVSPDPEMMREAAMSAKVTNETATLPLAILNANRDPTKRAIEVDVEDAIMSIPDDPIEASRAYQRIMGRS